MPGPISVDVITGWLDDHEVKHETIELGEDEYLWGLRTSSQPFSTVVAQRKKDFPYVFLQIAIRVSDEHLESLSALDESSRQTFMFDLRLKLLEQTVGYVIDVNEADPEMPVGVVLGYNMLEESPTRAGFLRRLHQMQNAAQTTVQMFKKQAHLGRWP